MAEDRLQLQVAEAVGVIGGRCLSGEELNVTVRLLPVQLADRPEQGLVKVGQRHRLDSIIN